MTGRAIADLRAGERGYTFIELAVVLVVVAVLTSIAYWRMGPGLLQARVNRAAWTVAADLQYAQLVAARERRPVVIIVSSSARSYAIREHSGTMIYRQRFLGQDTDFRLDALDASPTTVEVFPTGVARETTTFRVRLRGYDRAVRLTRAGQIRITSG
jgi:prepilin-type N-terminal cleavage/methylation domain-containing protein